MAFLDKLSSMAKNVGDKTGDMLETSKLNSKIGDEQKKIQAAYLKIGEHCYEKFAEGESFDPQVTELCEAIRTGKEVIAATQQEIAEIKAPKTPKTPPAAPEPQPETPPEQTLKCPDCGAQNPEGTKFCQECGARLDAPAPAAPEAAASGVCPSCGAQNPEGIKFCQECGARLEPPAPAPEPEPEPDPRCPACGAVNPPGIKFCGECGARL
ncbi:MAG: zinc ribbon domain-containing protein [Oscillospiraceae bacterium]|nr:zinc ribbon domain-containing protein [Oscillospiraceae bacterium]